MALSWNEIKDRAKVKNGLDKPISLTTTNQQKTKQTQHGKTIHRIFL